jgi:protein gp37
MGVSVEDARVLYRIADLRTVPFFFKQWGGVRKDLNGRELGGRTYDEMPRQPVIPTRREQFELVPA